MGSGESLKKTNEVWKEALSQPSQKGEEQQCFQAIRSNALLGKKYKKWLDDMKSPTQANEALRLRLLERILAEENNDTTLQPSSVMESSQQWLTDVSRFSASMSFVHPDEYSVSINPSKEKLPSSTESVESLLEAIPKLLNAAGKNPALYVQPHSFQTPSAALHPNGTSKSSVAGKNALRYLVHINSNYLICCLAADKLLNPHACFVFCNTVSYSPDGMKYKEKQISKKASKGNQKFKCSLATPRLCRRGSCRSGTRSRTVLV
ncbi:hypothetical protein AGDE_12640 [Angomonas deanei]|nr:hypothetical protein AGDE_12640 [Angomonas deanei]|eukprot:EPY23918.1 hypothetical protein AGDE_12640 [Angomonas deanei]